MANEMRVRGKSRGIQSGAHPSSRFLRVSARQKKSAAATLSPMTTPLILIANEEGFGTSMMGNTERITYSSVMMKPEAAAKRSIQEGFSPGATRGIANITRYASP